MNSIIMIFRWYGCNTEGNSRWYGRNIGEKISGGTAATQGGGISGGTAEKISGGPTATQEEI